MSDLTIEEFEKAAENIERISAFIGERRDWIVGEGGEARATDIREIARALATRVAEKTGIDPDDKFTIKFPPKLEPSAKISAARLSKFGDFLSQLREWFASQNDAEVPEDSADAVQSIHHALALVCAAVDNLLKPVMAPEPPPPTAESLVGEINDSPIAEVDPNARLVLEDTDLRPLVLTFKGITELTLGAKEAMDEFLADQSIELDAGERRRLDDKLLKWIEGTPTGQVLVIKLSGLSGKPQAYSSYQPKGGVPVIEKEEEEKES
jgi:hypothetical protein